MTTTPTTMAAIKATPAKARVMYTELLSFSSTRRTEYPWKHKLVFLVDGGDKIKYLKNLKLKYIFETRFGKQVENLFRTNLNQVLKELVLKTIFKGPKKYSSRGPKI